MSCIALGFVALAVGQTVASWSTDLVEDRRRLRVFVVVDDRRLCRMQCGPAAFRARHGAPGIVATANAAILAGVVIAIAYSLMRVGGETIFPPRPRRHA